MTLPTLISKLQEHLDLNPGSKDSIVSEMSTGVEIDSIGYRGNGISLGASYIRFEHNEHSSWEYFTSILKLANVQVLHHYEIPNPYWPQSEVRLRMENPWWLVLTHAGPLKIGWRKRVIAIDWSDTLIRKIVTRDDITKDEMYVHASMDLKAIEYLRDISGQLNGLKYKQDV